jgi:hypothetical protein
VGYLESPKVYELVLELEQLARSIALDAASQVLVMLKERLRKLEPELRRYLEVAVCEC